MSITGLSGTHSARGIHKTDPSLGLRNGKTVRVGSLQCQAAACAYSPVLITSNNMLQHSASEGRQPTCGAWSPARRPASCRFLAACHSHRMHVKEWLNRVKTHTKQRSSVSLLRLRRTPDGWRCPVAGRPNSTCTMQLSHQPFNTGLQHFAVRESDNQRSLNEQSTSQWAHPTTKKSSSRACHASPPEFSSVYPRMPYSSSSLFDIWLVRLHKSSCSSSKSISAPSAFHALCLIAAWT